ncbi:DUF4252 domain-containing protein [Winogradskyella aurantia]|uniref:DUF4252 domain-containing protein n=1 Tax=Winogradskyella aurantia TaxID=1915063 RepID=A0A265USC4_9FLAO|nr:DUF4252 domain-containing protein [Winogradskyella aurantia]OZV68132.1 hypothetical protein CA834_10830 [Winogradskyella aurantia]
MRQSIKIVTVVVCLVMVLTSCNQGPTLQTYYVDSEMQPGFVSYDVPRSFINVEGVDLTDKQREAYESVDKLNILAYRVDESNLEEFNSELAKIQDILDDAKYEELMRGGNSTDGKFVVKFLGDVDKIDELILFGNANDKGFLIARILGDDMNAGKLMSLQSVIQNANFDDSRLEELTSFFK